MDHAVDEATRLVIRRIYNAPVAAVYAAWTDPEQMKHWMGPSDEYTSEVTSDLRVGGRYRITAQSPGDTHEVAGVYQEIVPGQKLVFSWAWKSTPDRQSLVTITFKPDRDGTMLTLLHEQFFDEDARDRHQQGWTGALNKLEKLLA